VKRVPQRKFNKNERLPYEKKRRKKKTNPKKGGGGGLETAGKKIQGKKEGKDVAAYPLMRKKKLEKLLLQGGKPSNLSRARGKKRGRGFKKRVGYPVKKGCAGGSGERGGSYVIPRSRRKSSLSLCGGKKRGTGEDR